MDDGLGRIRLYGLATGVSRGRLYASSSPDIEVKVTQVDEA